MASPLIPNMDIFELKQIVVKQRCLTCNQDFALSEAVKACPQDGSMLSPVFDDPLLGTIIDDKYEISERIAVGTKSKIYKTRHLHLDKYVALKILQTGTAVTQAQVSRFQKEAQVAVRLVHPNIVRVYDYGTHPQPYIVMEYVHGKSLAEAIKADGPLPAARALPLFLEICQAMGTAHAAGLVHRDLKPSNVMIDYHSNQAKVLDFGLVKDFVDDAQYTKTGEIVGSPSYMSPEQWTGGVLDGRSDIYSIGCLMYETLTGTCPFAGNNTVESMFKHLETPAPKLGKARPELKFPRGLETVIANCLAKNPAKRYHSITELGNDLFIIESGAGKRIRATAPSGRWYVLGLAGWCAFLLIILLSVCTTVSFYYENTKPKWQKLLDQGLSLQINAKDNAGSITLLLEAERAAEAAHALPSGFEDIYCYLGQGYVYSGNPQKGKDYLERALRINMTHQEDVPRAHYHEKLAYACIDLQDYKTALEHANTGLDIARRLSTNPDRFSDNYYVLGRALISLDKYAEAADALEKSRTFALEKMRGNIIINVLRFIKKGQAFVQKKQTGSTQSIEFKEGDPFLIYIDWNLACSYYYLHRNRESFEAYGRALRLACEQDSSELFSIFNDFTSLLNDRTSLNLVSGIASNQQWPPYLTALVRGGALSQQQEFDKALIEFDLAQRETLNSPNLQALIYAWKGYCNNGLGRFSEAGDAYKQALALNKSYPNLHHSLADCLERCGRYDEAISEWDEALRSNPSDRFIYLSRGLAYFCNRQFKLASNDCRKFLALGGCPEHGPYAVIWLNLADRFAQDDRAAAAALLAFQQKSKTAAWPYPVISYLGEHITANQLQKAAGSDTNKLTEAFTYLGLDCLIKGKNDDARKYLTWVINHGRKNFMEYHLANAFLKKEKDDQPKSEIGRARVR